MFRLHRVLRSFSQNKIFLTAHGKDRIGIVKDICRIILDSGGNVLDSQMSRMSVFFSIIMIVDVPEKNTQELLDKFKTHFVRFLFSYCLTQKFQLNSFLETYQPLLQSSMWLRSSRQKALIILESFTPLLTTFQVKSFADSAPFGSATLFKLQGKLQIPEVVDIQKFKKKIEQLEKEVGVSINID